MGHGPGHTPEALLAEMRNPARQVFYLVGTPKGRVHQPEKKWLDLPWQQVRESVQVRLYEHGGELYVAQGEGRQAKEKAIRRKRLAPVQMVDVIFPTTDARRLVMPRYKQPTPEQNLLPHQLA